MTGLKIGVVSLGCNKNTVDTEMSLGLLEDSGYTFTSRMDDADILIVNTCAFIDSAKEESIDAILEMAEYKKTGKCRLLAVTGCLAQRYEKDLLTEIPEIDLLLGVNRYENLPSMIENALEGKKISCCKDDLHFFEHRRILTTPPYTAYIKIGEGCSNRCTFCAIPDIRGRYRSRSQKAITDEISSLAEKGVKEFILVAQDTAKYGSDLEEKQSLDTLMKNVSNISGVSWLRVLYCYPEGVSDMLIHTIAETKNICGYLDMPIQHINNDILRKMHRKVSSEEIISRVRHAKEHHLTLRTSIIVGFPGETEEQFQELLDFIGEARFDRLGAFTYSEEENTPASRLPDKIPEEIKRERYRRLMTLQNRISLENNREKIGQEKTVLVAGKIKGKALCFGRSESDAPETDGKIVFSYGSRAPETGSFVKVRITGAKPYDLVGVLAD